MRNPRALKMGVGTRHVLFPDSDIGRARFLKRGCQIPDAILHGKRSSQSHSRTGRTVSRNDISSEASLPGSADTRRCRHARQAVDALTKLCLRFNTNFRQDGLRGWRSVCLALRV